jgi:hypothetical protein
MRVAVLLVSFALTAGCNSSTPPSGNDDRYGPDRAGTTPVDVDSAITEFPILFQSWGGEWQGTDVDTELTLNADGTAQLSHFGTGDDHADATWEARGDELMVFGDFDNLVEMPGSDDWPKLQLRQANGRLYLFPTRETDCLQYEQGTGWPLGEFQE